MKYDIAIIGGGASGLTAAISAARAGAKRVAILEKLPRVGKKLLATGNGRCNILNANARPEAYFGDREFSRAALNAFSYEQAVRFFASLGLEIRLEENGCAYPASNQAAAVLDCLRFSAMEAGAEEITDFEADSIAPGRDEFTVTAMDGRKIAARRVIVACGGLAAPKLGGGNGFKRLLAPLGHTFTPCLPALSPLKTDPADVAGLKGLRFNGRIALFVDGREASSETGEILFTESGISGIAAMQLSVFASEALNRRRAIAAQMSLLETDEKAAYAYLKERARRMPSRLLEEFLTGAVVKRMGQMALKRAGAYPLSREASSLTEEEVKRLARELTAWRVNVTGVSGFDAAQVMLGGAKASEEFSSETMESKIVRGLFAAGELFAVTGPCGGYNLTWAWASGLIAGRSAAKSL